MLNQNLRTFRNHVYEANVPEFRCSGCGEWFTEYEMMEKSRMDMPVCGNCGSDEIVKCIGDWGSKECSTCEFENCPFDA